MVVVIFVSSMCTLDCFGGVAVLVTCTFSFCLIGVRSRVAVFDGVTSNPIALNFCSKSAENAKEETLAADRTDLDHHFS